MNLLVGCGARPEVTAKPSARPAAKLEPALIAEADREHDFSPVIGRPGQKFTHRYHLTNTTGGVVTLTDIINRKTCCGIVTVGGSTLKPGEATDVNVTLLVGDRFGGVDHVTEVVTDQLDQPRIILRTRAMVYPAIRIEEPARETLLVGSGPRRVELRAVATGSAGDPPTDLDRLTLRSSVPFEWLGSKGSVDSEVEGLTIISRRFAAQLDPSGEPGERRAEILLLDGERVAFRHDLRWGVETPLMASPGVAILKRAQAARRITIQSRDRIPFRITAVEPSVAGVAGHASSAGASPTHIVEVAGSPSSDLKKGVVIVTTDHPAQPRMELPFVVLD